MTDDAELLRRYVEFHSDADFTEFVGRHFSFVYYAALRRTGGRADLADDVTQHVFTAVARQASALCDHRVLAGWLYTTTRHAANSILRAERRRAAREQEANLMSDTPSPHGDPQWNRVRQDLDSVMDQLPDRDREAILLRFFHGQPFAQIGPVFGLSEDAARKRVDRALERLRECLVKRGITSTSAALGAMLSGEAALAAPAHMANAVASATLVQAGNAGYPAIGGVLQLMSTKTTLGIAGTIGLAGMLVITAIGVAVHYNREARQAEAAVAFAPRENQTQAAGLEQLRRDADLADTRLAEAQSTLDKLRAAAQSDGLSNAAASATTPARDPLADGKKFLATIGPARAVFTEMLKNAAGFYNQYFYRLANFTPAQIDDFENRSAAYGLETLTILENGGFNFTLRPPVDQMRQSFGDEIAQKFSDYRRRECGGVGTRPRVLAAGRHSGRKVNDWNATASSVVKGAEAKWHRLPAGDSAV